MIIFSLRLGLFILKMERAKEKLFLFRKASEYLVVNFNASSKDPLIPLSVAPISKWRQGVERKSLYFINPSGMFGQKSKCPGLD